MASGVVPVRTSSGRSMRNSSSSTGRERDDGGGRGDQVGAGAAAAVHPGLDVRAGRSVSAGALAWPPLERLPPDRRITVDRVMRGGRVDPFDGSRRRDLLTGTMRVDHGITVCLFGVHRRLAGSSAAGDAEAARGRDSPPSTLLRRSAGTTAYACRRAVVVTFDVYVYYHGMICCSERPSYSPLQAIDNDHSRWRRLWGADAP